MATREVRRSARGIRHWCLRAGVVAVVMAVGMAVVVGVTMKDSSRRSAPRELSRSANGAVTDSDCPAVFPPVEQDPSYMQPPGPRATEESLRYYREFQKAEAARSSRSLASGGLVNATISFDKASSGSAIGAPSVSDAVRYVFGESGSEAVLVFGFAGTHTYHSISAYLQPPFDSTSALEQSIWDQLTDRANSSLGATSQALAQQGLVAASARAFTVAVADARRILDTIQARSVFVRAIQVSVAPSSALQLAESREGAIVALREPKCGFLEPIVPEDAISSFVAGAKAAEEQRL